MRKLSNISDLLCLVPEKAKIEDSLDDFFPHPYRDSFLVTTYFCTETKRHFLVVNATGVILLTSQQFLGSLASI